MSVFSVYMYMRVRGGQEKKEKMRVSSERDTKVSTSTLLVKIFILHLCARVLFNLHYLYTTITFKLTSHELIQDFKYHKKVCMCTCLYKYLHSPFGWFLCSNFVLFYHNNRIFFINYISQGPAGPALFNNFHVHSNNM